MSSKRVFICVYQKRLRPTSSATPNWRRSTQSWFRVTQTCWGRSEEPTFSPSGDPSAPQHEVTPPSQAFCWVFLCVCPRTQRWPGRWPSLRPHRMKWRWWGRRCRRRWRQHRMWQTGRWGRDESLTAVASAVEQRGEWTPCCHVFKEREQQRQLEDLQNELVSTREELETLKSSMASSQQVSWKKLLWF